MKDWLERNKIYFETLAPVLISIAALFVSVSSYLLTEKQLQIASLDAEPNIYLKEVYLYDPTLKRAYEQELRIFNSGESISNFDASLHTIVEVEFYTPQGKQTAYVPLYGYYHGWYSTDEPTGELTLVKGHLNNERFFDVIWSLKDPKFIEEHGTVFLRLRHSVEVTYSNKLGEKGQKYFIDHSPVSKNHYLDFNRNFVPIKAKDLSDLNLEYLSQVINEKKLAMKH